MDEHGLVRPGELSQECRAAGLNPAPYNYKLDDLTARPRSQKRYETS